MYSIVRYAFVGRLGYYYSVEGSDSKAYLLLCVRTDHFTYFVIKVEHVLLQGHIRVDVVCSIARRAAPRAVEAGTTIQLAVNHNSVLMNNNM